MGKKMKARYDRFFSPNIFKALCPGAPLRFLIPDVFSDNRDAIDVQLREKDKLFYYHGTTSLLTIKLKEVGGNVQIKATADKIYKNCPEYEELMKTWDKPAFGKLRDIFNSYLKSAMKVAKKDFFTETKEGYWQNRLCVSWGRTALPGEKYIIIDRECVIGFKIKRKKDTFYHSLNKPYADIKKGLQRTEPKTFGTISKVKGNSIRKNLFGDNLDMLALDERGNLTIIELKHGRNLSGICWGPLQTLVYRDAFRSKLPEITSGIRELVEQKIALGLLPEATRSRLPLGGFPAVKALLVIAKPAEKNIWEDKMKRVSSKAGVIASLKKKDGLLLIELKDQERR